MCSDKIALLSCYVRKLVPLRKYVPNLVFIVLFCLHFR